MSKLIINGIDVSECCADNKMMKYGLYCFWEGGSCADNEFCYFKELKRLQKENAELKAEKGRCAFKCLDNTFCDEAKIKIDKLELDKDCLNASLETARKYRGIAEADRDKYKQAFEEIKRWATNHNPCDIEADINCTKEDCFECLNYDIKKITTIIDEVLKCQ